ncbi:hypothetical protein SMC26_10875 [Actinomadura fulvescens]|uniref:Uncharacterized protein n=1 Tax=Actinomadura fulvescens TaxID=46160 RepID=A0ABN3PWD6_9ACTN
MGIALATVYAPLPAVALETHDPLRQPTSPVATAGQFYSARIRVLDKVWIPALNESITFKVAGVGGVPATGVDSVALNIAAASEPGRESNGELVVSPSGSADSEAAATAYNSSFYAQNLVIAKVGPDGHLKITNPNAARVLVYADVHGYTLRTAGATAGTRFVPLKPARIGRVNVPANASYTLAPLGQAGIPTTGVSHAAFTITAKSATKGKLTVHPSGQPRPGDTNLDYGQNQYHQNHVFAQLGADGKVIISNAGSAAVTVDVDAAGYFTTSETDAAAQTIKTLQPANLTGYITIPAQGTHILTPLGKGGIPANGVSAVAISIFTVGRSGALRIFPSGTPAAVTHAVSILPDLLYRGFIPAKLGADGKIAILNSSSSPVTARIASFAYF